MKKINIIVSILSILLAISGIIIAIDVIQKTKISYNFSKSTLIAESKNEGFLQLSYDSKPLKAVYNTIFSAWNSGNT